MQSYIPTFDSVALRLDALGYSQTNAAKLDALAAEHPQLVLMLNADPHQHPEVADNAIIVPEVLKSLPAPQPHICWADPAASRTLASRFGVLKYPALVFLREGQLAFGCVQFTLRSRPRQCHLVLRLGQLRLTLCHLGTRCGALLLHPVVR